MSVATVEDGLLVAEYTRNGKLQHSTQLMPAINQIMEASDWKPKDLNQIAVTKGPGSYTGVRIGATIAKTLAWTLNIPLVPVSSLQVLAANALQSKKKIVPLIDARRKNVYAGVYLMEEDILENLLPDEHLASEDLFQQLAAEEGTYLFVGQDVSLYQERIQEILGERAQFMPIQDGLPRATKLAALSLTIPAVETHLFIPEYLKKPEAEEKWQEAHQEVRKGGYIERID